jgi:3-hydroxyacyl-CoA dehydrogenase/enoyl-CoA hydratase/3-hydroxybutyryl-CoA epimerase
MGAQPYILESKLFTPREALELGWCTSWCPAPRPFARPPGLDRSASAGAATLGRQELQDARRHAQQPKIAGMLSVAPAVLKQKTRGLYPRPNTRWRPWWKARRSISTPRLRIESRYSRQADRQPGREEHDQHVLLQHERDQVGQSRPKDVPRYKPQKVGILGAGMMGGGIAYVQASRGVPTVLKDVTLEKAEAGRNYSIKVTQPGSKRAG